MEEDFFSRHWILCETSQVPRLCLGWGITKTFYNTFACDFDLGLGLTE